MACRLSGYKLFLLDVCLDRRRSFTRILLINPDMVNGVDCFWSINHSYKYRSPRPNEIWITFCFVDSIFSSVLFIVGSPNIVELGDQENLLYWS